LINLLVSQSALNRSERYHCIQEAPNATQNPAQDAAENEAQGSDDADGETGILKPRTELAKETKEEAYVGAAIAHLATTDGLCGMLDKRMSNTEINSGLSSSQSNY